MEAAAYLDALQRESAAFASAARAGVDPRVPSCPGWTVGDLTVHLGGVHRWAAETVRTSATERIRGRNERWGVDASRPDLVQWFEEGGRELHDTLAAADPAAPVWTWTSEKRVLFWYRRQAMETAVHRWDAENAHGSAKDIQPELAADGVEEYLAVFGTGLRAMSSVPGHGESFHFHATDTPCEWLVRFEGEGMSVEPGHAKGDVAVRGTASDLLLFLWRRLRPNQVEVLGDTEVAERWFELIPA